MEEVRQTTTTQETSGFNRDRAFTLVRTLWRDFGPLVVGALVLILVLVGGWSLFKKGSGTSNASPQETVVDQQANSNVTLPESTININGASPSPTPTPNTKGGTTTATPTPTPSTLAYATATTKGGETLPKTGPEIFYGIASLASLAGGYFLHKKSKKLL